MSAPLNLAVLKSDITSRTYGSGASGLPKAMAPKEKVYVLANAGLSENGRDTLLVGLYKVQELYNVREQATWVLSIINIAFPELLSKTGLAGQFEIEWVAIDAVMVGELNSGQVLTTAIPVVHLAGGDVDFLAEYQAVPDAIEMADPIDTAGVFAILCYALGKAPNSLNMAAFNTNRTRAVAAKAGTSRETRATLMSQANFPALIMVSKFKGFFDMHPASREILVRELITWTATVSSNMRHETVATQVKLWRGAGMTAIRTIRILLVTFGEQVGKIHGLREEAERYLHEYEEVEKAQKKTGEFLYMKVIKGDRFEILKSGDFPELFAIGREYMARRDRQFGQYAAGQAKSAFQDEFERICTADGVFFPPAQMNNPLVAATI